MLIKTIGKMVKKCNEKPGKTVGMCQNCYGKECHAAMKSETKASIIGKFYLFLSYIRTYAN